MNDEISKNKIGFKRGLTQVFDTIHFEFKKNLKKTIIMLLFFLFVFALNVVLQQFREFQGVDLPEDPVNYVQLYLDLIGLLIIISASGFAGGIIAEDYQKDTRNLLFPKINKTRLLAGRVISLYFLNILMVGFYYALVSIITFIKYSIVPISILTSMGWALFYNFTLFTFVTFISSVMKSSSVSIIVSLLVLLIVFNIVSSILIFTGVTEYVEPLFILTYYGNIISNCLDMPDPRYGIIYGRPGPGAPEFTSWITPSFKGAAVGLIIHSAIFLGTAYILFKRRNK
ncbi:MAG: hypothetical protein GF329_09495 [Candidatus Lokiarchaeota archaeon]|nr:hypothetical protein [Candidatus Lokiarchaeota archaeon]